MGETKIEWTDVVWRAVPGWPGYHVTANGRLRGPTNRELKLQKSKSGHLCISRRLAGNASKSKKLFVHRAVLMAFVGPPRNGQVARHLNGNPEDNRLENLRWGTCSENMADRIAHGRMSRGEERYNARLTKAQVESIRNDVRPSRKVGNDYGVSHTAILRIRRGERWRNSGKS